MSRARVGLTVLMVSLFVVSTARADVTAEQVERAIRKGVALLKSRPAADGSWPGEPGVSGSW